MDKRASREIKRINLNQGLLRSIFTLKELRRSLLVLKKYQDIKITKVRDSFSSTEVDEK